MMFRDPKRFPVSSGQKRLFVLSQLEGGEAPYHLTSALNLTGDVDTARLEWAFRELVERHQSLRSGFEAVDDVIAQVVHPEVELEMLLLDDEQSEIEDLIRLVVRPFNLAQPPLMRVALIRRTTENFILIIDVHHIAVDGISWNILIQELSILYAGGSLEKDVMSVGGFSRFQNKWIGSSDADQPRRFWKSVFESGIPTLDLPTDHPRPPRQLFTGAVHRFALDDDLATSLRKSARQQGVTLNMYLLAVWSTLLHRLTRQDDLVIGFPTGGRTEEAFYNVVGMLAGTSLVRLYPVGEKNFQDYLQDAKRCLVEVFQNIDYPFETLVEELQVQRDLSRNPLFDTTFVYERTEDRQLKLAGVEVQPVEVEKGTAMFDVSLEVTDADGHLNACLEYSTALFERETIERWAGYYKQSLRHLLAYPETPLEKIPLLTASEQNRLLIEFNRSGLTDPFEGTAVERFLEKVEANPDAPALRMSEEQISFAELHRRALVITAWLREHGIEPGDRVALLQQRSPELIASLWGVLLAGAAYVSLDPSQPPDRSKRIIEDSGCRLLLKNQRLMSPPLDVEGCKIVDIHEIGDRTSPTPVHIPNPEDIAYIIYTSGTTGNPKGCPISHTNLMNYLGWAMEFYFRDGVIGDFPFYTSLAFDLTVTSIYCTLLRGRTLDIYPDSADSGDTLRGIFGPESTVDCVKITPTHLNFLKAPQISSSRIKLVILGGETVRPEHLEILWAVNPEMMIYNEYGPTETTVGCTIRRLLPGETNICVGNPISNTRVYVLGPKGEPVPTGVYGEITIAGRSVFSGYLKALELKAEKFVDLPFDPSERGYRTGDLGRWNSRGELECRGRLDEQVKVKGYRIEPGEIEAALTSHPQVIEAAVAMTENGLEKELACWVVLRQNTTAIELHEHLAGCLPNYMIPVRFQRIERIPLTVNGKRDMKKLILDRTNQLTSGASYHAPRPGIEERIAAIWRQVLKQDQIGIRDNYFLLGGDSIKAIQIGSRLAREGIHIQTRDLFDHPTIEQLALTAGARAPEIEQGTVKGSVPLSAIQREFFARHPFHRAHFTQAVLLQCDERLNETFVEQALRIVLNHHDALRMRYDFRYREIAQINAGLDYPFALECIDLSGRSDEDAEADKLLEKLPGEIDLTEGPMLRGLLLHGSQSDRLFLVAHHLVVDGVSWRIIVEDLNLIYRQLSQDENPVPFPKTVSFRDYAEHGQRLANLRELQDEFIFWQEIVSAHDPPLPGLVETSSNRQRDALLVSAQFDSEATADLLAGAKSNPVHSVQTLLLASLSRVLSHWRNSGSLIAIEGHGRDGWFDGLNLSRTVGWFTCLYPVYLSEDKGNRAETLASVKQALARIPQQGTGYGLLRWLKNHGELAVQPRISFNFLGEFDAVSDEGPLQLEIRPLRNTIGADYPLWHELEVEALIQQDRLEIHLQANRHRFDELAIRGLLDRFIVEIKALAEYLLSSESIRFPGIDQAELRAIEKQCDLRIGEIEEIIPLTPLQEGLLFHALRDSESVAYFEQFALHLEGQLDYQRLEDAWNSEIQRHSILRTRIVHKGLSQPWQVVCRSQKISIPMVDLSHLDKDARENEIAMLLEQDRRKGFDLSRELLMRATLVRESRDASRLLWSFPHILLDGWCMGIFLQELFAQLADGGTTLTPVPPFSDFIRWLKDFDRESAKSFWKQYLKDVEKSCRLLPVIQTDVKRNTKTLTFNLIDETTRALTIMAAREKSTLSSLIRTTWGLLLAEMSGSSEVLFGIVSSGRPGDLEGIERILGLFLTILPVRVVCAKDAAFSEVLRAVQQDALDMNAYQYLPLAEIKNLCRVEEELFDHIVAYENYPLDNAVFGLDGVDKALHIAKVDSFEQTHYAFSVEVYPGDKLGFRFLYDAERVSLELIEKLRDRLIALLTIIADRPDETVGALLENIRGEAERLEEGDYLQLINEITDDF